MNSPALLVATTALVVLLWSSCTQSTPLQAGGTVDGGPSLAEPGADADTEALPGDAAAPVRISARDAAPERDPTSTPDPGPTPDTRMEHHRECAEAPPSPLPPLPPINMLATGRPAFDTWRDIPCEQVDAPLCSEGESPPWECGSCILGVAGANDGVCNYFDADNSCDGEGEAIGFGEGTCQVCGPVEARARACCEGLEGFDCRSWPYDADGRPGTICARHEDCEPGLVCAAPSGGAGYGVCACPGVLPSSPSHCGELYRFQ